MDNNISNAVNEITPYLIASAPYLYEAGKIVGQEGLKEISKKAISKVGEKTWGLATRCWEKITGKNDSNSQELETILGEIVENPNDEDVKSAFRYKFRKVLKNDEDLFSQLNEIIQSDRSVKIDGEQNINFGDNAKDNLSITGDGNVVGSNNINLVRKEK
jgi:hypothetical protein